MMKNLLYPLIYQCPNDTFRMSCHWFLKKSDNELMCHLYRARKSKDSFIQKVIKAAQEYTKKDFTFAMSVMKDCMVEAKTISEVDDVWNFFKVSDHREMLKVPWIHVLSHMTSCTSLFEKENWEHVLSYAIEYEDINYFEDAPYKNAIRSACLPHLVRGCTPYDKTHIDRYNQMLDAFYVHGNARKLAKEQDAKEGLEILCEMALNDSMRTWLKEMPIERYEFAIEKLCRSDTPLCASFCIQVIIDRNNSKGFLEYIAYTMGWYGLDVSNMGDLILLKNGFYEAGCAKKMIPYLAEDEVYENEMKFLNNPDKNISNKYDETIYMVCRYSGSEPEVVNYIKEQPDIPFAALYGATVGGHFEIVRFILDHPIEGLYYTPDFATAVKYANNQNILDLYKKYVDGIQDKVKHSKLSAAYDFGKKLNTLDYLNK